MTGLEEVALAVQTADCLPILIAEQDARCVAAIHAGWRGTAEGITEAAVRRLAEKFGADAGRMTAAIGPHIGVCCYEVGRDVLNSLGRRFVEHRPEWSKPHLNLAEANRRQLLAAGIRAEQIEISTLCTRCRDDLFFSYRREGSRAGRMLSFIGIDRKSLG